MTSVRWPAWADQTLLSEDEIPELEATAFPVPLVQRARYDFSCRERDVTASYVGVETHAILCDPDDPHTEYMVRFVFRVRHETLTVTPADVQNFARAPRTKLLTRTLAPPIRLDVAVREVVWDATLVPGQFYDAFCDGKQLMRNARFVRKVNLTSHYHRAYRFRNEDDPRRWRWVTHWIQPERDIELRPVE